MTCSECQVQIFDGQLDRDAVVHLTACDDCHELDREVRLNASALASMREDVLPVRRARRWPWMVAVAAAALMLVWSNTKPVVVPQPVAVVQPEPVAAALPVPVKPVRVRRARPANPAPPAEPLLVKFFSDDPDVVIYWLVDPVQGEQAL